jgi:hypothetical protein
MRKAAIWSVAILAATAVSICALAIGANIGFDVTLPRL